MNNMKFKSIASISLFGIALSLFGVHQKQNDEMGTFVCDVNPITKGLKAEPCLAPSDDKYSEQKKYSMNMLGNIESVWDNYTGSGIKVAVIDDGFYYSHPEYTRDNGSSILSDDSCAFLTVGNQIKKYSFSNPSEKQYVSEFWDSTSSKWNTHGTNVSTTLGAPIDNGGIVGIAPEVEILAIHTDFTLDSMNESIKYAISQGVDIINMSIQMYGSNFYDYSGTLRQGNATYATYLDAECQNAYDAGIIVVASAGNYGTSTKSYPACNSHVIGVGSLYRNDVDTLAPFTNYNRLNETGELNVDILAPGYVYAAGLDGASTTNYYPTYNVNQGTSFSSPIVAGAAALWKQKNPEGTPDDFFTALSESADGIGEYASKMIPSSKYQGGTDQGPSNFTCGRLNVESLLNTASPISISLSKNEDISLYYGGGTTSTSISANVLPSSLEDRTINWSLSNNNVVNLSKSTSNSNESIAITSKGTGTVTLVATSNIDSNISESIDITVNTWAPITGISLVDTSGNSSSSIDIGETQQLVINTTPNPTTFEYDCEYSSDDENIATVDENGLITGIANGTTYINVLVVDEELNEYEDLYEITVRPAAVYGSFVINAYDSSTLNNSDSQTSFSLSSFNNKVTIDGVINNGVLSAYSNTKAYARHGGISLGTSGAGGTCTFTVNNSYAVKSVRLVGTCWSGTTPPGTLTVGGVSKTSGSLNAYGTTLANCTNSMLFEFTTAKTSFDITSNARFTIYTLECFFQLPSPVYVTDVSLDKESISLYENDPSTTLTASYLPANANQLTTTWTTSVDGVVELSGSGATITVTPVSEGTVTITATCNGHSDSCLVTVNGVILERIFFVDAPTTFTYKSTPDFGGLKVYAEYNHGDDVDVTEQATINTSSINTGILGNQQINACFTAKNVTKTVNSQVFITNNGSSSYVGTSYDNPQTVSYSFTSATWGTAGTKWTSGKDGAGYSNSGVQVTKNFTGANATCNVSYNKITGATISYCTNSSSGAGSIAISVGGTSKSANVTSTGGTTARNLPITFDNPLSGQLKITVTCSTNSIYVCGITINYSESQSYPATPAEQASAYADYFLTFTEMYCDPTGEQTEVGSFVSIWPTLASEYGYMVDAAKDAFITSSSDNIVKARSLYQIIYTRYHSSLNDNNFMKSSNGNDYVSLTSRQHEMENNDFVEIVVILVFVSLASFSLFKLVRKRKAE